MSSASSAVAAINTSGIDGAQFVELDLSEFRGRAPVELFGQTRFPLIGELPYLLSLGPHGFYWFRLDWPNGRRSQFPIG